MKTIDFTDQELSKLGIGTWFLGENPSTKMSEIKSIRYGIEHGIQLIDTAEMYGEGLSEKLVGEAIQPYDRSSLYIVSKVYPWNANPEHMEISLNNTLRRLNTDYLDMYLYHWRGTTPLEATISEFERMKSLGKINNWGVSNFDTKDMKALLSEKNGSQCRVNQVLYHLGDRGIEYSLAPYCAENNINLMAYCPLAQAGQVQHGLLQHHSLIRISQKLDLTVYQLLLCFIQEKSNIIPIPRTSSVEHMKENLKTLDIHLPREIMDELDEAFPPPSRKTTLTIV